MSFWDRTKKLTNDFVGATTRTTERVRLKIQADSLNRSIVSKKRKWGEEHFDLFLSNPELVRQKHAELKKELDEMVQRRDDMYLKAKALAQGPRPIATNPKPASDSEGRKVSLEEDGPTVAVATPAPVNAVTTDGVVIARPVTEGDSV